MLTATASVTMPAPEMAVGIGTTMWMLTATVFATMPALEQDKAAARAMGLGGAAEDNKRGFVMRSNQEVSRAIDRYGDTIRRLCMIHLKNYADTEDIFQTVFLKYALRTDEFESDEHERAWFIRVTINACKDLLKSFFRSRTVSLDPLTGAVYKKGMNDARSMFEENGNRFIAICRFAVILFHWIYITVFN